MDAELKNQEEYNFILFMNESKCKKCRRAQEKLFLKGDRCFTQKCAMIRAAKLPGVHGAKRRRAGSEYGVQLNEKQKVKRSYFLREKQFRNYFDLASKKEGVTGEVLLETLERRLDNVVFRSGLAGSRSAAKQIVGHGHMALNGRRVDVPSILVKVGDKISIRKGSESKEVFKDIAEKLKKYEVPAWLDLNKSDLTIEVKRLPQKEDIEAVFNMQLITEFYSR